MIDELVQEMKVLGDKTRLRILSLILNRELCVCEIVEAIGISQPGISQHLRRLREAGFVNERRDGQWAYYEGNREKLEDFRRRLGVFFSEGTGEDRDGLPRPLMATLRTECCKGSGKRN